MIIEADLNFSIGSTKLWGQFDPLFDLCFVKLEANSLISTKPMKIQPTCPNKRKGEEIIANRLDIFMVTDDLTYINSPRADFSRRV